MKNSKLIELLKTFDANEWRQFEAFVASPYFNGNENLTRLGAFLGKYAPDFSSAALTKEKAHQAVFPGTPFDARQMGYLMNYMIQLAEEFISIQHYRGQSLQMKVDILAEYSRRELEKHYNFLYRKTKEELDGTRPDLTQFEFQYSLAKVASEHFIRQRVRSFDPTLQNAVNALDELYFLQKLRFSIEMLNRQAIVSTDYELSFMDEVQGYLSARKERLPLIDIYLHIYLSLANDNDERFTKLIQLIELHSEHIEQAEKRLVYLYAINFCARKIRQGKDEYVPIVLNLYLRGIRDRSLFEEEYLSHWTYTNVVKLFLRQKEFEQAEAFIKMYSDNLSPQSREDALHFNLAELYYQKEEYGEVLSHLSQLNFSDLFYHMGSRTVLIKTYYESEEIESLLSLLASFSNFLRRNKKIASGLKKTYLNFCNLLFNTLKNNPQKREKIREEIQNTQPLAERAWLLKVWGEQRW
ncbi:MAG: hypothetical protein H6573_14010 [Lewinellaceae bacterium]|nr:hypothetical protein [Phaeodactylibacter sp.]MCB0612642.1 hypothetical protein [Phaeodactylibacter sp.]MCB9348602.1 hypothetical protein [Lewinellaceae bacterium]